MNMIQRTESNNLMRTTYPASSQQYMMASRANNLYPRHASIDMGPELPENFTIWPPTPQIGMNKVQPPATESFTYSLPEDYATTATAWDTGVLGLPDSHSMAPHAVGIVAPFDSPIEGEWTRHMGYVGENNSYDKISTGGSWSRVRGSYNTAHPNFNADLMPLGSHYGHNDESGLLDTSTYTSYSGQGGFNSDALGMIGHPRRLSDASTSLSSHEHLVPPSSDAGYDEYSSAYDIPPPLEYSQRTLSSTPLSPGLSPRSSARAQVRSGSRSRSSPSPRPTSRAAPYLIESPRNKRWSTGSYYSGSSNNTAYLATQLDNLNPQPRGDVQSHHTSPICSSAYPHSHPHPHPHPYMQHNKHSLPANQLLISHTQGFSRSGGFLSSSQMASHQGSTPIMGYPFFRGVLGSNVEPTHSHYSDLTDPPDLYASLHEKQIPPPPEDMNPEDPDMKPHEQELRFEGDLYTPRWVRGHGNKREGWCGICKPGRWLVLKNSAFWYDKSFTHGISAATGQQFVEPKEVRRMDGNPDVWEGLCHSCNEWVALVSNKKKGTTWFRHAYKCHTHPKIKDAPKRRRESSSNKTAAAAASAAKSKSDASSSAAVAAAVVSSMATKAIKAEKGWR